MIPKIIHYCWISGEESMPEDIKMCLETWKKQLPDYEFINWNDSNFDWNICEFTKKWREKKHYAYCSDYIRAWALYNYGGIYLDSDVKVYKSFDELLKLDRFLTMETSKSSWIETAIMGSKKNDELMKLQVDWFNNYKPNDKYVTSPCLISDLTKDKYTRRVINDLSEFDNLEKKDNEIYILNNFKFFNKLGDNCFAEHKFKNSWVTHHNKIDENIVGIFVYANKPINSFIPPRSNKYTILATDKKIKDSNHKVIYLEDEFSTTHQLSYNEGCGMKYLYEHQEILPPYIVYYNCEKTFSYYVEIERLLWRDIDKHGAIISNPMNHSRYTETKSNGFNGSGLYWDHSKDDIDAFITSIKESAHDYWNTFKNELFMDENQYNTNCFAMKKEHFIEMCEMCFRVLDHFDKKMGYKNDNDVINKVKENKKKGKLTRYTEEWHYHLQSYLLERLTELYYRQKFGVENCHKTQVVFNAKKPC